MYVCICHAVTDTEVKQAIQAGADSVSAVTRECKAGGDCGSCRQHIEDLIDAHYDCPGKRLPVLRPTPRAA